MNKPTALSRWRQLIGWPQRTPPDECDARRPATSPPPAVLLRRGVQRVARNYRGRDFAVGDIHGCFELLQQSLNRIGFDPEVDRLFAVGDLVDRGPHSIQVLEWLARPWFFSVCGNHDHLVWRALAGFPITEVDPARLGNEWLDRLNDVQRHAVRKRLQALPLAIEVATAAGWVGVVHASCANNDWKAMHELDMSKLDDMRSEAGQCMWATRRAMLGDATRVRNIRAVIHGHVGVGGHLVLGNSHFIDTGGWRPEGHFTLLDLDALRPAPQLTRASAMPSWAV